jgi:TonB family protein
MLPGRLTRDKFGLGGTIDRKWAVHAVSVAENHYFEESSMILAQTAKLARITARASLAIALLLTAVNLSAQETRKAISNPAPRYPELAKTLHLSGVVKVQVVIAPDGKIISTKVLGGHPLLVSSVEETLKKWKYAPASTETTALLEFEFRP